MANERGRVLADVDAERNRQASEWGNNHHPDGTGGPVNRRVSDYMRDLTAAAAVNGTITWVDILREEVFEAFAESDPIALRTELIQVGAVALAWVEDIDARPEVI